MNLQTLSVVVIAALGLGACTGPQGPSGPQGYQGRTGQPGDGAVIVTPVQPVKATTGQTVILTPVR